jgi:hypothetical protein
VLLGRPKLLSPKIRNLVDYLVFSRALAWREGVSQVLPVFHSRRRLLTEIYPQTETINCTMRLEASADSRSVLLAPLDTRKLGSQREWRVEITPEELIALIRAHGTEVSGYLVDFEIQVR